MYSQLEEEASRNNEQLAIVKQENDYLKRKQTLFSQQKERTYPKPVQKPQIPDTTSIKSSGSKYSSMANTTNIAALKQKYNIHNPAESRAQPREAPSSQPRRTDRTPPKQQPPSPSSAQNPKHTTSRNPNLNQRTYFS